MGPVRIVQNSTFELNVSDQQQQRAWHIQQNGFLSINNSQGDKSTLSVQDVRNSKQRSRSTTSGMPSINKTDQDNSEMDDCFVQFGFAPSTDEKKERIDKRKERSQQNADDQTDQDQPAHLVEEIDAITALFIYDIYSKKHEFTLSSHHRAQRIFTPKSIRDDIDRFDGIYACLIDQDVSSKNDQQKTKTNRGNKRKKFGRLSDQLRDRFVALPPVNELIAFQQTETSRVLEQKRIALARLPFIPGIAPGQRTCAYDDPDEIKWIRDHLC